MVSYLVKDDAGSGLPTVLLGFGFEAIEATFYEDGLAIAGGTSRLALSGASLQVSGGGPGPKFASNGEHLLAVFGDTLRADSFSWSIPTPFDFVERLRGNPQPDLFYVRTDVTSAGGLFADLAAGGILGDIELHSYDSSGALFQTWAIQTANLISYRLIEEADTLPPKVELGFGFDAIAAWFLRRNRSNGKRNRVQ